MTGPWIGTSVECRASAAARCSTAGERARTNDQGEYRVTGVQPGEFYLRTAPATQPAERTTGAFVVRANNVAPTYYPGVTSPDEATVDSAAEVDYRSNARTLPTPDVSEQSRANVFRDRKSVV